MDATLLLSKSTYFLCSISILTQQLCLNPGCGCLLFHICVVHSLYLNYVNYVSENDQFRVKKSLTQYSKALSSFKLAESTPYQKRRSESKRVRVKDWRKEKLRRVRVLQMQIQSSIAFSRRTLSKEDSYGMLKAFLAFCQVKNQYNCQQIVVNIIFTKSSAN